MTDDSQFLVSGWEDDANDVDDSRNPSAIVEYKILEASENGDLETIKELLRQDPNLVHTTDKDNYTPLHRACYANNLEVVKYLVSNGANLSAKTEMQWEPLHSCCQWGNFKCAAVLIQHGANVNAVSEGGQTPLHIAATHGKNYDVIQMLLLHPYINPFIKNNSGETAADIARRSSKYYNVFDMADPLLSVNNIELLECKK
ncbi:ankyrin repeat domain-containing protein 49-like [Anthonomus grandis grandis]|uniref:ankyrin repeat domain-containing protein 49-like n=1 Tax=Anthonomus grandis grandis TaxID=2921223 RepID=UPI0021659B04|nr:ankyrin repeat domain-containing protein 49-like [Anthonomus grandis grandis]